MNDQQIDDLKQFIAATVSQTESNLDAKIDLLRQETQDGFAGVSEVIEALQNNYDENIEALDQRLKKLEQQSAQA